MQRILVLSCLIWSGYSRVASEPVFTEDFSKELDAFIKASMSCQNVPGLTISVVKGNDSWTHGFGLADVDRNTPVDVYTLFNIGSITKSFTMALVGTLLTERAKKDKQANWSWTTKLKDILGSDYGFSDPQRYQEATLRDLLSHRTGVGTVMDFSILDVVPRSVSRERFCKLMRFIPNERPFRDGFEYQNMMYLLLGHVAEKLGGDTYENLLQTKILGPLGMQGSSFLLEPVDVQRPGVAKPYLFVDGAYTNGTLNLYSIHPAEPAGFILSSADDMRKWTKFLLGNGQTKDGTQLIDEDMFKEIFEGVTSVSRDGRWTFTKPVFPVSYQFHAYGYALFTANYRGYKQLAHSGGLFSYVSDMWLYPDLDIGLFASTNGPGTSYDQIDAIRAIFSYISDELLHETPWLNISTACSFPEPWRNLTEKEKEEKAEEIGTITNPAEYVGRYGNAYMPTLAIDKHPENESNLLVSGARISGVMTSLKDTDKFIFYLTGPMEMVYTYMDEYNNTEGYNVTFQRSDKGVDSFEMALDVKVQYLRGHFITDPLPTTNKVAFFPPR